MSFDGMPINDKNTPAETPTNDFTRMIELVHARNQGVPVDLPRSIGVPIAGTPLPSARSADLGRPVDLPPADRPLTPDEIDDLNRQALASGLVQGPVNPAIARTLETVEPDAQYASLEDAIRAGASVDMDEAAIEEAAQRHRAPGAPPIMRVRPPVGGQVVVAGSVGRPVKEVLALPKLPDFKKVQMIDLVNAKVYVDGVEFMVTPDELKMLRKFAVTKAKEQVQQLLDEALKSLAEDADGEEVH
jgi:hypothetical protein